LMVARWSTILFTSFFRMTTPTNLGLLQPHAWYTPVGCA
jgi:hypothetical protein